jgi:hypothetical protein
MVNLVVCQILINPECYDEKTPCEVLCVVNEKCLI